MGREEKEATRKEEKKWDVEIISTTEEREKLPKIHATTRLKRESNQSLRRLVQNGKKKKKVPNNSRFHPRRL